MIRKICRIAFFLLAALLVWMPYVKAVQPDTREQVQETSKASRLSLSELAQKYHASFFMHGPSAPREVALTFDDGPDMRFTGKILDVLAQYHVKATFFIVGYRAESHPDLVRRIVNEGHVVGNHSYGHAFFPKLKMPQFEQEVRRTESILTRLAGYSPALLRPPYGAINEEQVKWLIARHYLLVNWNVDSLDWKSLKADRVFQNIMGDVKPGSIILQHAGGGRGEDLSGTIEALPRVIKQLRREGYVFVTVPALLHASDRKKAEEQTKETDLSNKR